MSIARSKRTATAARKSSGDRSMQDSGVRGNAYVLRALVAYLASMVSETAGFLGVVVYAFERDGARVAGYVSLICLVPYAGLSAMTSRLVVRFRPGTVYFGSFAAQVIGYLVAAAAVAFHAPLVLVVFGGALAFTAVTALRPCASVLFPAAVRTSFELTVANVWMARCQSLSIFAGPLIGSVLLQVGGPGPVLFGCAVLCLVASALSFLGLGLGPSIPTEAVSRGGSRLPSAKRSRNPFSDLRAVARRPGLLGVLGASSAHFLLVGAFDLVLVVIAGENIDLGNAGAGILAALVGGGSFVSSLVAVRLVRRPVLAPLILVMQVGTVAACLALGLKLTVVTAIVVLPLIGFARSGLDLFARVLLQRSGPPSELPLLFGASETAAGVSMVVGSVVTQICLVFAGAGTALLVLGAIYAVFVIVFFRSVHHADTVADVPVVAMSLLRRLQVFAPLPTFALESVARSATEIPVEAGTAVIRQGDPGDRFYAVVDGEFDVVVDGTFIRKAARGDSFGEVALLADVPRTATITAVRSSRLLGIDRIPFLVAVTGSDSSREAAWGVVRSMTFGKDVVLDELHVASPQHGFVSGQPGTASPSGSDPPKS